MKPSVMLAFLIMYLFSPCVNAENSRFVSFQLINITQSTQGSSLSISVKDSIRNYNFSTVESCTFDKILQKYVDCVNTNDGSTINVNYTKHFIYIKNYGTYKIFSSQKTQAETTMEVVSDAGVPYRIKIPSNNNWITLVNKASLRSVKFYSIQ